MILKTGYNETITEYSYDSLNRLIKLVNKKSSGEIISSFTYTLGPAGNRIKVDEVMLDMSSTITYTYDNLYRLTGETRTGSHWPYTITYTYDNVGNRLTKTQDGITTTYTYDENDRLIQENTPEATITYTYDNNGNTIEKRTPTETTTYTYDFDNRLISATINGQTTTYTYDGDGNRVKKIDGQGTVNYLIDTNNNTGFSQVVFEGREGTGDMAWYVYGDDLICAVYTRPMNYLCYYHYDGLGSTRNLTNQETIITNDYWYDAFGNLIGKVDQYPVAPVPNNYLFTGEQFDKSLRFYYLRARYYNPEIGRFITTDPVEGNIYEPISLHKYLYAGLDPVNKIDPSGEEFIAISITALGIISLFSQQITSNIPGVKVFPKTGLLTLQEGQKIVQIAITWIGVPYQDGAGAKSNRSGTDCSGLVWLVYREAGYPYPYRTTYYFSELTNEFQIDNKKAKFQFVSTPQEGDVMLFKGPPGNMAIYAINGEYDNISALWTPKKVGWGKFEWFKNFIGYYRYYKIGGF
jgi:RHS repeat-associated protein